VRGAERVHASGPVPTRGSAGFGASVELCDMSELLRVGFVGCGVHASHTIWPCLRYAPVEVAYACDTVGSRAETNRRRFGAGCACTDLRVVLDDESVEAVFVVGPPAMHHEVGLRVLEAGKHLFTEKPPGATLAHAIELEAAADRRGVSYQVGFQKRFALGYRLAREVATQPEFGGVRLCKVNYSHWRMPDWRKHLVDMAVHPLDLVRYFMGDPRAAHVLKRSAADGRSTCLLMMQYDSGASAVVNMSASDPHVQEWVELSGANQLISVRNLTEYRHWAQASDNDRALQPNGTAIGAWHPEFALPNQQADSMWLQGYAGAVVDFVEAIVAGRRVTPSIADGVAAMRYVEAIACAPDGMSEIHLGDG
jgi:predicted dehydrogenase